MTRDERIAALRVLRDAPLNRETVAALDGAIAILCESPPSNYETAIAALRGDLERYRGRCLQLELELEAVRTSAQAADDRVAIANELKVKAVKDLEAVVERFTGATRRADRFQLQLRACEAKLADLERQPPAEATVYVGQAFGPKGVSPGGVYTTLPIERLVELYDERDQLKQRLAQKEAAYTAVTERCDELDVEVQSLRDCISGA